MIMVTGIAVLGLLSGSLASFFRLTPSEEEAEEEEEEAAEGVSEASGALRSEALEPAHANGPAQNVQEVLESLTREVSALRRQVEVLSDRMGGADPQRE
jgi:hypothetical protein